MSAKPAAAAAVAAAAETITLYFKEGSSDKVYTANLVKQGAGWVVTFAYGRRGSTMNTGTKTQAPVEFATAKKIYDRLVAEKTGKGYTPGEGAALYTGTSSEARDTGVRPQLLNEMSDAEVEACVEDAGWGAQEKLDGRRLLIKKKGFTGEAAGINRKGLTVALAAAVLNAVLAHKGSLTLDGEAIGERVHAFDLLELDGEDLRTLPYSKRHELLRGLKLGDAIQVVPLITADANKRALVARLHAQHAEGVVFKRLAAPYKPGRPDSGGDQLKYKFYATGSFIVARINAKRSVAVKLANGAEIGNVTITPNKAVPKVGDIIEVRYLYCFKGGSLYQPTFLAVRDDLELEACTAAQLKFKPEGGDEEDA